MATQTVQKPQPRILTFTKPDNIRGSVHGKISAYNELWDYAEMHRFRIFMDKDNLEYGLAYHNATNTQSYIIDRLKELKCINISFNEKWLDT
jgi:hypothetical protein